MIRDETIQLLMIIQAAYPNYKPIDKTVAVNTWYSFLKEYDFKALQLAVKAYVLSDTNGFPPSIGQIVDKLSEFTQAEEDNANVAWLAVSKALRNGCYGAEEEFNKLPTITQKVVGSPKQLGIWASDPNFNEQVEKSHFIKTYREEVAREKELSKYTPGMRNLIQKTNQVQIEQKITEDGKLIE